MEVFTILAISYAFFQTLAAPVNSVDPTSQNEQEKPAVLQSSENSIDVNSQQKPSSDISTAGNPQNKIPLDASAAKQPNSSDDKVSSVDGKNADGELENTEKLLENVPNDSSTQPTSSNKVALPSAVINYINNLSPNAARHFQRRIFPKLILYPPGTPRGDMIVQMLTLLQQRNLENIMRTDMRKRRCRIHDDYFFENLEDDILSDIRSVILDFSDTIRDISRIPRRRIIRRFFI